MLTLLSLSITCYALMQAATVPTLPALQDAYDASQRSVTWTLTAFLLSSAVSTPILGRLGDAYGRRRVMLWSLGAVVIGCLMAALAPTIEVMVLARVIQGMGGGIAPLVFAMARDLLPAHRVPGAIAWLSAIISVGFAAGIVIAGIVTTLLGFRALFLLPALFAAATSLGVYVLVPESTVKSRAAVPLLPASLLMTWLVTLLLAVSQAPTWGWDSTPLLVLLSLSVAGLITWAIVEWRAAVPMIDLRLMRRRAVWPANLVAFTTGVSTLGAFPFLAQFNQIPTSTGYGFGASVIVAGYLLLPASIGSAVAGAVSSRLAARIGNRAVLIAGGLMTSAGLAQAALHHETMWQVAVATGVTGLGSGLVFACLANAVVAAVPSDQTGVAMGMNANLRTVGGAVGTTLMATIIAAYLQPSGHATEAGWTAGFWFLASMALVSGVASVLITTVRPGPISTTSLDP